jgi:apolipoprotein N-acyltransferase
MDFPNLSREYANEVGIMLVPAWDFKEDGRIHAQMAVMRGIENGFSIARAAREGEITASDSYGRILARGLTSNAMHTEVVSIPMGGTSSLYGRFGDWFPWLCSAIAAIFLFSTIREIRKVKSEDNGT